MRLLWPKLAAINSTSQTMSPVKSTLLKSAPGHMSAWQCLNFSANEKDVCKELHCTTTRRIPTLSRPDHILVKVDFASLNPVDRLNLCGYGASSFRSVRYIGSKYGLLGLSDSDEMTNEQCSDFPFTPGRDFSGRVAGLSASVSNNLQHEFLLDQPVVGATWPFLSRSGSGSLAEYVVCPSDYLTVLPDGLEPAKAAAIGYAGLTAWSALVTGGLVPRTKGPTTERPNGPLVLVTGATGGVGLIAAQLAKLWGARVQATCRSDEKAITLMNELNLDDVIVYPDQPPMNVQYDVIIDCIRPRELGKSAHKKTLVDSDYPHLPPLFEYLKPDFKACYVSLNPPLLNLFDRFGLIAGGGVALSQLVGSQLLAWNFGLAPSHGQLRWGFFQPSGKRLASMLQWAAEGRLKAFLDSTYTFDQVPDAFTRLQSGGVRGKILIKVSDGA